MPNSCIFISTHTQLTTSATHYLLSLPLRNNNSRLMIIRIHEQLDHRPLFPRRFSIENRLDINMGGKIDCYIDYILKSYDVKIEFHPIFLGGVNVGSGNKPPWTLPAKAKYSKFDADRAREYFGVTETSTPSFFPILSLLPQRALTYIKHHHPENTYHNAILALYRAMWNTSTHHDISKPELLRSVLSDSNLFSSQDVDAIMSGAYDKKYKDLLTAETEKVIGLGAFGAPWLWVRNEKGEQEPFFGSDRFHFMWRYLGLDWQDIKLLPSSNKSVEGVKAKL